MATTHKIALALFLDTVNSEPRPLGAWAERMDYTRVSEYVEVTFPPRPPEEYVPEQVATIEKQMEQCTAKYAQVMAELKTRKADLLSITLQAEPA
jgi:hypothetical protein